MLKGLFKTTLNVATLPIDIVGDTVEKMVCGKNRKETRTERKLKNTGDSIESIFDMDRW